MKIKGTLAYTLACSVAGLAPIHSASASPQDDAVIPQIVAPLSSQGQVSAITRNPALLGAIGRWELELLGYYARKGPSLGTRLGAFAGLRPLKNLALGLGLSRQTEGVIQVNNRHRLLPPLTELSLGVSLGNPNRVALGLGLHTRYRSGEKLASPDLHAGLVARLGNYISLGSTFRHRPRYGAHDGSARSHSRWSNELAVRPLGTPWIEVAGESHLDTRRSLTAADDIVRSNWRWGGRLSGTYKGVGLDFVARQRVLLDPKDPYQDDRNPLLAPHQWQWGMQLRLATRDLAAYLSSRAQGGSLEAFGLGVRVGPGVGPSTPKLRSARRALSLNLDEINNEYDLVRVLEKLRLAKAALAPPVLIHGSLDALGWASAMELRGALDAYKTAGGRVFAHISNSKLHTYYLATVAETIYLAPTATLGLYAPGRTSLYFKETLDKLSIQTEWMHTGPYKTAYERFAETGPSEPDIDQRARLYDLISAEVLSAVASSRSTLKGLKAEDKTALSNAPDKARLRDTSKALDKVLAQSPISAKLATSLGLADGVHYLDAAQEEIAKTLEVSSLNLDSLTETRDDSAQARPWGQGAYIGVVVVQGSIVSGQGFEVPVLANRYSGDESFEEDLSKLASDPDCYGVIVRVNSPGGSAQASDRMWKSVHDFIETQGDEPGDGKPLVISMGDAAASGGYYLSVAAPQIFAQPLTITGSIGVTALHWDVSKLASQLGIQTHRFGGNLAQSPHSPFAPWSETQRKNMHRNIFAAYDLFVSKVHEGRNLSVERVKELAGGRVWSGYDAKSRGLIDAWGGYEQARAWVVDRLSANQQRQVIGLRVLEPDKGLLSTRLAALGARLHKSSDRQPATMLSSLLAWVAQDPSARALLDLLMLPQDTALSWSAQAASAEAGHPR